MPVDRSTVEAHRRAEARAPERRAALVAERDAQRFVALKLEDLLAEDGWGVLRRHLEALRDRYRDHQRALEGAVLGDAVGPALQRAKLQAREAKGFADALAFVAELPTTLHTAAEAVEARCAKLLDTPEKA